ncbi:HAD family hydrolase [Sphingomonas quercus]|uniref:HAD family hydrolase n=1 Tax=Sphingomonas quercus TaxID=2842451 RepID=A0ABS6BFZ9_9SPHN|nr:HAD family hydrolase [Sphingomonas quercus]MBU3077213.1 HAD family hydrolase [Sphingomonas quercus]
MSRGNRPLLVTDCDEVLLHMLGHFADWLDEAHAIDFDLASGRWPDAFTRRADGCKLGVEEAFPLLDGFFASEMHRQTPVPGAVEALGRIAETADIVVLTNLKDHCHADRVDQLARHGIAHRVICNQGGKGRPLAALVAEMAPGATVFVDDLAHHHESVAQARPDVWRLHMVAEPRLAANLPPAPHAHARIDDWDVAAEWILERMAEGEAA